MEVHLRSVLSRQTTRSSKNKENPMAKGQSLQDPFLNALRKERVPVSIYLVNGIKLQGQIDSFDQFVVLLKNSVSQMVYKHAISTVVPARNVRLAADEGGVAPEDLQEFKQLAVSAGALPVATLTGRRERPDSRYFLGSGKAEELRGIAQANEADIILVDHALSPSQERNLEKLNERRVLDRNGLILDIFAQRARSFEGKLEVELAQLKHVGSRLVRGWTHLERQKGGIGLRGPGETQLETDRRIIAQRVRLLTRRLAKIQQQRETGRQTRATIPVPSLALVGYTNAGKSTLFRALTGADAYVADQLFATLDPTVRRITLPGGTPVVAADTVGFIRELPHELVAAFQSTLTEARAATLLLHMVDASNPRREEHIAQVDAVLKEIGAEHIPQVILYNKIDRLSLAPRLERD